MAPFIFTAAMWALFFCLAKLLTPKPPKEIQEAMKARKAKQDKDPLDILRSY